MRTLTVLVVIGALGAGAWLYFGRKTTGSSAAAAKAMTVTVMPGTLVHSVSSTGRVVSNLDVDIKCKASGEIIKLPFDVSDRVSKGDLLVELDPVDEQRGLRLAKVALDQSRAKLEQARQNLLIAERNLATSRQRVAAALKAAEVKARDAATKAARRKELLDQNLASQEDYDTAMAAAVQAEADLIAVRIQQQELEIQELALELKRQDVKLAEAAVAADAIAVENAQRRLDDTKVVAPMDGVVAARNVQTGQIISSGITNVGGGTTILTLSDLSRIFVLAAVDESDIGQVALEQPVRITVDAHPGVQFRGKVVRIATRGVNVSNVVTFEVKIEVTSDNRNLLKPEMTANVQIICAERKDVLLVPTQAVSRRQGQLVVTVQRGDGTTEERPVKVGMNDGSRWEIVEGLTAGEVVVVPRTEAESRWRAGGMPRPPMGGMMMPRPR